MKHPDIINTDLQHFQKDVIEASGDKPILVDFWAEWCSPCLVIAPVLEKLVTEYDGAVRLVKLEVDEGENMKLAGRYKVRGFPTIILFKDGEELGRFSSARPAHWVREFIDDLI